MIDNAWAIVFRTLKFSGFNVVVTQYSQIIPLVLQAPRFFAGQISLGDIQQTASAFSQVEAALSFFRLAYDDFASFRATLIRLDGPPRRRRRGPRAPVGGAGGGARALGGRASPCGCPTTGRSSRTSTWTSRRATRSW